MREYLPEPFSTGLDRGRFSVCPDNDGDCVSAEYSHPNDSQRSATVRNDLQRFATLNSLSAIDSPLSGRRGRVWALVHNCVTYAYENRLTSARMAFPSGWLVAKKYKNKNTINYHIVIINYARVSTGDVL